MALVVNALRNGQKWRSFLTFCHSLQIVISLLSLRDCTQIVSRSHSPTTQTPPQGPMDLEGPLEVLDLVSKSSR